jgi:hypothetical protein
MSNLIEKHMQNVTLLKSTRVPDGEGGNRTTWDDDRDISAAITFHKSNLSRVAEHDETKDTFNVTTRDTEADLPLFAVIRDAGGKTYRITSAPREFPAPMSIHYKRYSAEGWDLP